MNIVSVKYFILSIHMIDESYELLVYINCIYITNYVQLNKYLVMTMLCVIN